MMINILNNKFLLGDGNSNGNEQTPKKSWNKKEKITYGLCGALIFFTLLSFAHTTYDLYHYITKHKRPILGWFLKCFNSFLY